MLDFKKCQAICEAASGGPWGTGNMSADSVYGPHILDANGGTLAHMTSYGAMRADASFIAYARMALPKALDEIQRLNDQLAGAGFREDMLTHSLRLAEKVFNRIDAEGGHGMKDPDKYDQLVSDLVESEKGIIALTKRLELSAIVCLGLEDHLEHHMHDCESCKKNLAAWRQSQRPDFWCPQCGSGNDESPPDHTMDCETRSKKPINK